MKAYGGHIIDNRYQSTTMQVNDNRSMTSRSYIQSNSIFQGKNTFIPQNTHNIGSLNNKSNQSTIYSNIPPCTNTRELCCNNSEDNIDNNRNLAINNGLISNSVRSNQYQHNISTSTTTPVYTNNQIVINKNSSQIDSNITGHSIQNNQYSINRFGNIINNNLNNSMNNLVIEKFESEDNGLARNSRSLPYRRKRTDSNGFNNNIRASSTNLSTYASIISHNNGHQNIIKANSSELHHISSPKMAHSIHNNVDDISVSNNKYVKNNSYNSSKDLSMHNLESFDNVINNANSSLNSSINSPQLKEYRFNDINYQTQQHSSNNNIIYSSDNLDKRVFMKTDSYNNKNNNFNFSHSSNHYLKRSNSKPELSMSNTSLNNYISNNEASLESPLLSQVNEALLLTNESKRFSRNDIKRVNNLYLNDSISSSDLPPYEPITNMRPLPSPAYSNGTNTPLSRSSCSTPTCEYSDNIPASFSNSTTPVKKINQRAKSNSISTIACTKDRRYRFRRDPPNNDYIQRVVNSTGYLDSLRDEFSNELSKSIYSKDVYSGSLKPTSPISTMQIKKPDFSISPSSIPATLSISASPSFSYNQNISDKQFDSLNSSEHSSPILDNNDNFPYISQRHMHSQSQPSMQSVSIHQQRQLLPHHNHQQLHQQQHQQQQIQNIQTIHHPQESHIIKANHQQYGYITVNNNNNNNSGNDLIKNDNLIVNDLSDNNYGKDLITTVNEFRNWASININRTIENQDSSCNFPIVRQNNFPSSAPSTPTKPEFQNEHINNSYLSQSVQKPNNNICSIDIQKNNRKIKINDSNNRIDSRRLPISSIPNNEGNRKPLLQSNMGNNQINSYSNSSILTHIQNTNKIYNNINDNNNNNNNNNNGIQYKYENSTISINNNNYSNNSVEPLYLYKEIRNGFDELIGRMVSLPNGMKRFECALADCSKSYKRRDHLLRHIRTHNNNSR